MAELKEAAEQFARDLMAQNIAGLMMTLTPEGMSKAMMMQAQMQSSGRPQRVATGFEVKIGTPEGEDTPIDIVMKNEEGEGVIITKWREVMGAWKVNDMSMKPQPE